MLPKTGFMAQKLPNDLLPGRKSQIGLFIAFLLGAAVYFMVEKGMRHFSVAEISAEEPGKADYKINRLQGYRNIRPVLLVETAERSEILEPMRKALLERIEGLKASGDLTEASLFIKEFDQGNWTAIGDDIRYHPASLMKVILMMGYLRFAENNPGLFEEKWLFEKTADFQEFPQYFEAKAIEPGKAYTVHELLLFMIAHSDNNATRMLASRLDKSVLQKMFVEFGLTPPAEFDMNLAMTAREYSTFFNAIFNASNLSPEYAEYAADLLGQCSFKKGFGEGFPSGTRMWHKFGQWKSGNLDHELHESGVVFIKDKPYLVTIMTRGKDTGKLAEIIRGFCGIIYNEVPAP